MINNVSSQSLIISGIKNNYNNINIDSLIEITLRLTNEKKSELIDLICYLNISIRLQKYPITKNGIQEALSSIFNEAVSEENINVIMSMCTHRNGWFDKVASFTKTAEKFFKNINLNYDLQLTKNLEKIKTSLDSNLKKKLDNKYLHILIKCAKESHIDLSNTNLSGVDLTGANLCKANLFGMDLSKTNLREANLSGANLNRSILSRSILIRANLSRSILIRADLRGADLRGADLTEANLCKANLFGMDLSETNLREADLSRANLNGADLSRANLSGADLSKADLSEADLSRADLSGADLSRANLNRADLTEANLSGAYLLKANLIRANLTGANLSGANLNGANLSETNLRGTDLSGIDLSRAILIGANLSGIDLSRANLNRADLNRADLSRANLFGMDLRETNLNGANLSEANLKGANLNGANLNGANLSGTNLSGMDLSETNLIGANLSGVDLNNTKISINLSNFNNFYFGLDIYFNHINNPSGSILTTINSIDDNYKDLKVNLMKQVITWLNKNGVDIETIIAPLEDILYNNPIYEEDKTIIKFTIDKLLPEKIKLTKTQAVILKDIEVNLLATYIDSLEDNNKNQFMLVNNALINQIIYCAESSLNENIKDLGKKLKDSYFELAQIQELINYCENTENCFLEPKNDQFIFLYRERYTKFQVIMVEKDYMTKFLYNKNIDNINLEWGNFVHFKNNEIQTNGKQDLKELFNIFTIFKANYQFDLNNAKFIKLLNLLNLGNDYRPMFINALNKKSFKNSLIDKENLKNLKTIFSKDLTPDDALELAENNAININIRNEHYDSILEIFDLLNKKDNEKAQVLLCLSGVFAKYSSSSFFGTEADSPTSIRYYALALMNKAIELDSAIVPTEFKQDNYDNWHHKFLGIDNAFTCTAVLSDKILSHCRIMFPDIINAIIPPAWK